MTARAVPARKSVSMATTARPLWKKGSKRSMYQRSWQKKGPIQAEGSFAVTMEDMDFRRCNYRGMESVLAVSILCAIAYDINKLHFKIQGRRTGQHLTPLKESA